MLPIRTGRNRFAHNLILFTSQQRRIFWWGWLWTISLISIVFFVSSFFKVAPGSILVGKLSTLAIFKHTKQWGIEWRVARRRSPSRLQATRRWAPNENSLAWERNRKNTILGWKRPSSVDRNALKCSRLRSRISGVSVFWREFTLVNQGDVFQETKRSRLFTILRIFAQLPMSLSSKSFVNSELLWKRWVFEWYWLLSFRLC